MAQEPCSVDEIARAAKLLNEGKHKDSKVVDLDDNSELVQNPSVARIQANQRLGFLGRWRITRALFGDYIAANGINRAVLEDTKANNMVGNNVRKFNEAIRPLMTKIDTFWGLKKELDEDLFNIMEAIGKGGKIIKPEVIKNYSPEKVKAAMKVREVFDDLFSKNDLDWDTFVQGYVPHIKRKGGGALLEESGNIPTPQEKAFIASLTPSQIRFVHSLERTGAMTEFENKLSSVFSAYLHASANQLRRKAIENIERDVIFPHFNASFKVDPLSGRKVLMVDNKTAFEAWREYRHAYLGGIQQADRRMTDNLSRLTEAFGYAPVTGRAPYQFSHVLSTMFYTSTMGLRPASIIRQFGQLIPSFAEFGPRFTRQALSDVLQDIGGSKTLLNNFRERGLMTSHIENLVQSLDVGRSVGRGLSAMSDVMLKGVAAVDSFTRMATARAADLRFDKFLKEGKIAELPGGREIKDTVLKAINSGDTQGAKDLYAVEMLSNLQFVYGKANRPEFMRGALGNLTGIFMSYPLNSVEMVRYFAKRGIEGVKSGNKEDIMAPLRLVATTALMLEAGSQMLDADLTSMSVLGAMPHSMAFPKMGLDAWQAGSSTAEWLGGKVFETGETAFHKQKRLEAWSNTQRNAGSLLMPGGGFYRDMRDVLDTGSVARALALTPKGQAINQQNALRRQMEKLGG